MVMMPGIFEIIILTYGTGIFLGGSIVGLPPGDRDPLLVQCAPQNTIFYSEWAERGPGKQGAPGIDGLAADPEVLAFLRDVENAFVSTLEAETAGRNGVFLDPIATKVPQLLKAFLNQSGCIYLEIDAQTIAKAQEQERSPGPFGNWQQVLSGIKATLIINADDDADQFAETLTELLKFLPEETRTKNIQRQTFPLPPGLSLTLHRQGKHFILGFGEGTIDQALAGLSGKSQGLKQNARFTAAMERVKVGKMSAVGWVDVQAALQKVATALGPAGALVQKSAADAGVDKIDSYASGRGVIDGKIHNRTFLKTDGTLDGLLSLAAGRAIHPDDLSRVPADSDFVFSLSLGLPKILAASRKIIAKAHPPSQQVLEQALNQLESELELSIEDDFFKAFGDVWTIYNSKSAGGLFVSNLVGSLEVRDTAKAETVFAQIIDLLQDVLPGDQSTGSRQRGVFLVKKTFMDRDIYFVNTVGDDDVPVAPAFCLTDKQLLIGPHPQAIKAHLRFLNSKQKNFTARLKKLAPESKGELLCVSHFDTKSLVRYLYALSPYFGQIAFSELQSHGVNIDLFSLPSARAILPYVDDSVSTIFRTRDGILFEGRSVIPLPLGSIAFTGMRVFLISSRMRRFGGILNKDIPRQVKSPEPQKNSEKKPAIKTTTVKGKSSSKRLSKNQKVHSSQTAT